MPVCSLDIYLTALKRFSERKKMRSLSAQLVPRGDEEKNELRMGKPTNLASSMISALEIRQCQAMSWDEKCIELSITVKSFCIRSNIRSKERLEVPVFVC